ncbi:tRNA (guanine-N(1)-)-methyltransferase [Gaeumannomyces tritici R3-111a-1]|uniref:tRNA (guanine(37)-N1)-methyltransferase n=1 Tax=Gaeumannomyces tritici (strain R3-111a-1) TaxID=644352 RepID=J3P841_GAET3|nr:tRNA (guanine-N(1)-)-methyltransferase [Gaeumannomyces tritici R3-111a-1]EJT72824.1 tRNA (guanine-N(1)-)-methyltransferase [Gaeumannomyces tritici R3-111a-1]
MAAADDQAATGARAADMNMIKPPIVRSAGRLNKALFDKTFNIAAAAVKEPKKIGPYQKALEKSKDLLRVSRLSSIFPHPDPSLAAAGRKCILLRPGISATAPETWGEVLKEGVEKDDLNVVSYELKIGYDFWNSHEILSSILPEEYAEDIPTSYNCVGHVAHLNLRKDFEPYKHIIGQVIGEKNNHIRTVINKISNVGTESEFRTFNYEVLFGPDDLNVEVKEAGCTYKFDYSKVYWNSKLDQEHKRIFELVQPGEVLCDAFAGIGPFAIPAGKRGVFVWANDKNPESYRVMERAAKQNKAHQYVRPFNRDAKDFIRFAADDVMRASSQGECVTVTLPGPKFRRSERATAPKPQTKRVPLPPTISHYVMNLPALAITFLGSFRGLYAGHEALFSPRTKTELPMIHVHCFDYMCHKDDDMAKVRESVSKRVSEELGFEVRPGDASNAGEVSVRDVRAVAPNKTMYCASFRLPPEVAFAPRG